MVKSNNIHDYFDDIFSIETVGIYKPDSKVYEMPTNKYNCDPQNICFMSSNTWDIFPLRFPNSRNFFVAPVNNSCFSVSPNT